MDKPLNRVFSDGAGETGVGRALRRRLAATTIFAVAPFLGYGRQAHAACDTSAAPIITCNGAIAGASFNYDNAQVITEGPPAPQFVVSPNGLSIEGNGHIQFTDNFEASLTNTAGHGLSVVSNGDVAGPGGTPGAVTIVTNGTITGQGGGDGILARSISQTGDHLTITTGLGSNITGSDDGIEARNYSGDLTVTSDGDVSGIDDGIYALNAGIDDPTGNSRNLTITTGAQSVITGGNDGIDARNYGSGDFIIDMRGSVTGLEGSHDGIIARNGASAGDMTVTVREESSITGGSAGLSLFNDGTGSLSVTANGQVTGGGSDGIHAETEGSGVSVITGANSAVQGHAGIVVENDGTGDTIVTARNTVTGMVTDGIRADNSDDTGDLTITATAASVIQGRSTGIVSNQNGTGDLIITADGMVSGASEDGIRAVNGSTAGDLTVTTGADSRITAGSVGITVRQSGAGEVSITVNGEVESVNRGVLVRNMNGSAATVSTGAGSLIDGGSDGIYAYSRAGGDLSVFADGDVTGRTGNGIKTSNEGNGATVIAIGGTSLVQGNVAGIWAVSDAGQAIGITNNGIVRNFSGASDALAIHSEGGATTIDNNAGLVGTVVTSVAGDTLNNAGLWNAARGASDFGNNVNGLDVVNNTGTLIAANDGTTAEQTFLLNLEFFNNAGLVSLIDGEEGDTLTLHFSTTFVGQGGSRLGVDAFLGPGGTSDQLFIGLDTSGVTYVVVNSTNPIGSAPNFEGIPVVVVNEITVDGHFDVEGGVLNAGFFAWDMRLDTDGHTHELYTIGFGAGSYEFAAGIGGAQEVWHQTNGTILQRQADLRALLEGLGVTPAADYSEPVAPTPVAHITPGFWMKGVGAYIERDDEEDGFILDRKQTIWGGLAGFDFGTQDVGDALMFGLFAGYLTSDLDFDETNTEWTYEGPTVGAYATYLDHAFHVDATVKVDFLDIEIDPEDLAPAADDADTDAINIGGRLDAGYKFGQALFIEPQATLAVVHTEIDDVDIFGGTVEFDDATSIRGRLGLRLGHERTADDGVIYAGDVTASVWEDFSDDNEVTIIDTGLPDFGASVEPGQTYGDVALGFNVLAPDGWSGFIRANYLFAADYEAISGNAGLRYAW